MSSKDQLLPIAPEFLWFLRATSPDMREGYVFSLTSKASAGLQTDRVRAGRIVAKIGAQAKVKWNLGAKTSTKKDHIYPAFGNSRLEKMPNGHVIGANEKPQALTT